MLSALGYAGLRAAGITALARRLRGGGVILCYHNLVRGRNGGPHGDPGLHLPADRFEDQVRWLSRHYTVVSLHEVIERIQARRTLRGLAALTFDDGYAGVFALAWPVLHQLGLPATVFVVAGMPDSGATFWWDHPAVANAATLPGRRHQWLHDLRGDHDTILESLTAGPATSLPPTHRPANWETIAAAVGAGLSLGAHSLRHRSLIRLTDAELECEVVESRLALHRCLGVRPEFFAYPYGAWDGRVRDVVRGAGYLGALTLEPGFNTDRTDPWALRRMNVPAGIGNAAFQGWLAGLRPRPGVPE